MGPSSNRRWNAKYHVYASRANKHADIDIVILYFIHIVFYCIPSCSVLFCFVLPCHVIRSHLMLHIYIYHTMIGWCLYIYIVDFLPAPAGSCRLLPGPAGSIQRQRRRSSRSRNWNTRSTAADGLFLAVGWLVGGWVTRRYVIARVHFAGPTFSARGHMPWAGIRWIVVIYPGISINLLEFGLGLYILELATGWCFSGWQPGRKT